MLSTPFTHLKSLLAVGLLALAVAGCAPVGVSGKYHTFHKPEDAVLEHLRDAAPERAIRTLGEEREYFLLNAHNEDILPALNALKDAVLEPVAYSSFTQMRDTGADEMHRKLGPKTWRETAAALAQFDDQFAHADTLIAFMAQAGTPVDSAAIARLDENRGHVAYMRDTINALAERQFVEHALWGQADFFNDYPVALNRSAFMDRVYPTVETRLKAASISDLGAFYGHYGRALSTARQTTLGEMLWTKSCNSKPATTAPAALCKARDLAERDLLDDRFVLRHVPLSLHNWAWKDLDVDWGDLSPLDDLGRDTRFTLQVRTRSSDAHIETVSTQIIDGRYQSGTRPVANPRYTRLDAEARRKQMDFDEALNALEFAQEDYERCLEEQARLLQQVPPQQISCSTYALDRAQNDMQSAKERADEALAQLARTSPTVQEPVYTHYTFTKTTKRHVEVNRYRVSLNDRHGAQSWKGAFSTERYNEFYEYDGLREDDEDNDPVHGDRSRPTRTHSEDGHAVIGALRGFYD